MKVGFVGDLGVDHYTTLGRQFVGGCSFNSCFHFLQHRSHSQLKHEPRLFSPIGDEDCALKVKLKLEEIGLSYRLFAREGRMPVQDIALEANGEKNFLRYEGHILNEFLLEGHERDEILTSDFLSLVLCKENMGLIEPLLPHLKKGKYAVDFMTLSDFSLESEIVQSLSSQAALNFYGLDLKKDIFLLDEISKRAKQYGNIHIATLGENGGRIFTSDSTYSYSCLSGLEVRDTTGAGDSFLATFLSAFLDNCPLEVCIDLAKNYSSKIVGEIGATDLSNEITHSLI